MVKISKYEDVLTKIHEYIDKLQDLGLQVTTEREDFLVENLEKTLQTLREAYEHEAGQQEGQTTETVEK